MFKISQFHPQCRECFGVDSDDLFPGSTVRPFILREAAAAAQTSVTSEPADLGHARAIAAVVVDQHLRTQPIKPQQLSESRSEG